MTRSAADVRNEFLEFFRQHEHAIVPGSPVVPYDDPTLLFTNAGMNQFKDVFLGAGTRAYTRAADSQPCIRAGGKHNDLDDVGQDTYHHTFFEMLGNWSFGDYFKKEAIAWAWELLTDVWGLEKDRLHATYFEGDQHEGLEPDLEAKELWAAVTDIDPTHIHPGSKKDNFWEMGPTGPCGPCSEVHIDLTPDKSGIKLVNAGDARVIEIWNLVFIQFNRDASGTLTPLPARHVDTGMGFERVCALLQGKSSNYDTDVFTPIFQAIRDITGAPPYRGTLPGQSHTVGDQSPDGAGQSRDGANQSPERKRGVVAARASRGREGEASAEPADRDQLMIDVSYRVIADHARCLTFALNDGAVPDREGRGYVLRRILRRAARYGWQYMNMHEPFLYKLVPVVIDTLGDAFPQLKGRATQGSGRRPVGRDELTRSPAVGPQRVAEIIREEEESFDHTLGRGMALFTEAAIAAMVESAGKQLGWKFGRSFVYFPDMVGIPALPFETPEGWREVPAAELLDTLDEPPAISGASAFKLHDTYGFPIDLTEIMAQEKGLRVDIGEYERLMEQARERARAGVREEGDAFFEEWRPQAVPVPDDSPKYAPDLRCHATIRMLHVYNQGKDAQAPAGTVRIESGQVSITTHNLARVGAAVAVVPDRTCFYAESGGQVSDTGTVRTESGEVLITRLRGSGIHCGYVTSGEIRRGQRCVLEVDAKRRALTMQNHTATHVMNWALRAVLGEHVQQKGSLVDPDKTRFDFSHPKAMTPAEIERVEQLVNDRIRQNLTVYDEPVPQEQALKIHGLRAVFGEKYPDVVRVMSVGVPVQELLADPDSPKWHDVSIEFCGGTHCHNTGQIEHFAITTEEAVAKGIRRVVGITGRSAQLAIDRGAELLRKAEQLRRVGTAHQRAADRDDRLETGPTDVAARAPRGRGTTADTAVPPNDAPAVPPTNVAAGASPAEGTDLASLVAELQQAAAESNIRVVDRTKLRDVIAELQRILRKQHKRQAAAAQDVIAERVAELLKDAPKIGETTVVVAEMPDLPVDQLKTGADMIKQKCKSAAVLFGVHVGATERQSDEATKRPFDGAQGKLRDEATKDGSGQPPLESEPEAQARAQSEPEAQARAPSEPGAPATGPSEPEAQARAQSEPGAPATGPSEPGAPATGPSEPGAPATGPGKALLLAAMSNDLVKRGIKAGDLVKHLAPMIKGGGGGPPTMAQAGGKDPSKLADALEAGRTWIEEKLA